MSYTKGPWVFTETDGAGYHGGLEISSDAMPFWIAKVQFPDGNKRVGEANARLIAAAPEMLEALRNLMSSMIAAKMAEAGRIGISGTLPELRERFPECFKEIDAAADIIYRVESNGVQP